MILPPSFFDDAHVLFERLAHDNIITKIFTDIYAGFRGQKIEYKYVIKGYTNLLIAHLIRNYSKGVLSENMYLNRMQKLDKINSAVRYINENFTEKITTSELSNITHLSEGHFCNVFKEATGMTAKEYINELRIKKASYLISNTDMTITEAAMCSSFSDTNYFTRMFKKITGKTPYSLMRDR